MLSTPAVAMAEDQAVPLLQLKDLHIRFESPEHTIHAVSGISLSLDRGESLAIVGESGSGKTVATQSILGLLPQPPAVVQGEVLLDGTDLLLLDSEKLRKVRGSRIAVVFQDPMTSLNPVLDIARQMTEAARTHLGFSKRQATNRAADLLARVGIPDPKRRLSDHPHQFSGGQRQRICIAMALMCDPELLIADEPTTALDVTIQAQIMELVTNLKTDLDVAIMWITHDLGVAANLVERISVMYGGRIVESGKTSQVFSRPQHPYTAGLLASLPGVSRGRRLKAIPGHPLDARVVLDGCDFEPRCSLRTSKCIYERPELESTGDGAVACFESARIEEVT